VTQIKVKVLEPENFSNKAVVALQVIGSVELSSDISKGQSDAEVLFVRLRYQLDSAFLSAFPKLRYIVSPTTGEDHVDRVYIQAQNIQLLSLKGEREFLQTIPATAEFTWGLLLSLVRRIGWASQSVCAGEWNRDAFKGHDLFGKTIGLLGYGRVANIVTRYARAFGLTVKAYDPYVSSFPDGVECCSSLHELVKGIDILSVHALLSEETINLIGNQEFELLPNHAVVLNTSRGDIVDAEALLAALAEGKIAGAAIDVIPGERADQNSIKDRLLAYANNHSNLLITPHLAGATYESMEMTEEFMVGKLLKLLVVMPGLIRC
tara:strand:- start:2464 stop:3426 length:963 start_codon:yes stop_codon:yes gene_type:complete